MLVKLLPHRSMDGYFVYCVCTVTDFSAAEKARGVKFCTRVGLLFGQVFFPVVKIGLRGVTGAAA